MYTAKITLLDTKGVRCSEEEIAARASELSDLHRYGRIDSGRSASTIAKSVEGDRHRYEINRINSFHSNQSNLFFQCGTQYNLNALPALRGLERLVFHERRRNIYQC